MVNQNVIVTQATLIIIGLLGGNNLASMTRQPTRYENPMGQQFANSIKGFPQRPGDLTTINQKLLQVQNELQKIDPDLFTVVHDLNQIKTFALASKIKNEMFPSSIYGRISIEQFMNILDDSFIKPFTKQLQGEPPKPAPAKPTIPVPQKPGPMSSQKPAGLSNAGNSCFMNAAIQSLVSLERLNEVLLKPATINVYIPNGISTQYIELIKNITATGSAIIDPLPFCLSVWQLMQAKPLTQQDAPEFSQLLVQRLVSQDVNPARIPEGINPEIASLFMLIIASGERNTIQRETTEKNIEQNETSIRLPINPRDKTLLQCLQNHFKKDELPDFGLTRVRALLGTSFYFLTILGRTEFVGGKLVKTEQPISFALNNFDISSLSLGKRTFAPYRLKACIIHNGVPGGGHYTAYVRKGQSWFFCNDAAITPVTLQEMQAIAQRGYGITAKDTPVMFFYEQQ